MTAYEFNVACKNAVINYYKESFSKELDIKTIDIVWSCWILGSQKALVTTSEHDGLYFECTYNKTKDEMYFDVYAKTLNKCIKELDTKVSPKEHD